MLAQRKRTVECPSPKNGKYHVALLVGGPHDIFLELQQKLAAERGIWIEHHWEWRKNHHGIIPKDVDLIIILKDMLSHALDKKASVALEKRVIAASDGVPFIRTVRKWAIMSQALEHNGWEAGKFPPVDRTKPIEPQQEILPDPRQFAEEPVPAPVISIVKAEPEKQSEPVAAAPAVREASFQEAIAAVRRFMSEHQIPEMKLRWDKE